MAENEEEIPLARSFTAVSSDYPRRALKKEKNRIGHTLTELYAGICLHEYKNGQRKWGCLIHDGTYTVDFMIADVTNDETIVDEILTKIREYSEEHCCKVLGAGISPLLEEAVPGLPPALWRKLDIIPFVINVGIDVDDEEEQHIKNGGWTIDEEADSLARKCLMLFAPTLQPRLAIGVHNNIQVDDKGRIRMTTIEDYERCTRPQTWSAIQPYIKDLVNRKVRIVFFNATPQGGGVALMRHALLRYFKLVGVQAEWFVPRPKPDVFRITKTNHNILQGVVDPSVHQKQEDLDKIKKWIKNNAERYWMKDGGPLAAPSNGGADIIIVDDPQMPELIPLAKQCDSNRPVIFRSHIEVRDDLVQKSGSAAEMIWQNMFTSIKLADLFISHPVESFVPDDIKREKVGYMPATSDWLDGLNKTMRDYDVDYYLHAFNDACKRQGSPILAYPSKRYICQIARFDPAKGIPDVIRSFSAFRAKLDENGKQQEPQLVICGHSSVDDPDGTAVFDQTMKQIEDECANLKDDIVVARLGPSDQMLNAILSKADVVLQLSTREGFEVKVSEALHKGKPVIVTNAGGIPLQVHDKKNGFIVPRNSPKEVANHLYDLWTDNDLYTRLSKFAVENVSDEVQTVGNALCWSYLASKMTKDDGQVKGKDAVRPNMGWINDLAREEATVPYAEGEPQLWRHLST